MPKTRSIVLITLTICCLCCGEPPSPYPGLLFVNDCPHPCLDDVDKNIDYLQCVPVQSEVTGDLEVDIVGVWFQPSERVDGFTSVIHVRPEGVMRWVYEPGDAESTNSIRPGTWRVDNDELYYGRFGVSRTPSNVQPGYIEWEGAPVPWIRVVCDGFGFGDNDLPDSNCDNCLDSEVCKRVRDNPIDSEACLPDYVIPDAIVLNQTTCKKEACVHNVHAFKRQRAG